MESTKNWRFAPIRYRLTHLLYVTALIASAGATFGPVGLIVGGFVMAFWLVVFMFEPISYGLRTALSAVLAVLLMSCCLILPATRSAREAGRRTQCSNNLKQFGLGLHNYHDTYKQLPPTYLADQDGKPMHSWRTLIMPFCEQIPRYEKYDFSEPWNGPNNSSLHSPNLPYQVCPEAQPPFADETSYVAVCGEGASWTNENALKFSEFSKGTSNTILVIETSRSGIHWMEPRDFSLEEAVQELSNPDFDGHNGHRQRGFFVDHGIRGHNVLMGDGSVQFIAIASEEAARDLLSGNYFDIDEFNRQEKVYRLRYGNIARLTVFITLSLLPIYWVVVRMRSEKAEKAMRDES